MLNSLNFCLFGKLLISPLNLKDSLAESSILGCRFFPFITLNISWHSLLACRASVEKSADSLMGVPLHFICHFSLIAFNILSRSLIFVSVINMCSSLGLSFLGLSVIPELGWLSSFPCLGGFQLLSLKIFSQVLTVFLLLGPL